MLNVGLSSFVRYLIDVVPTGIDFFLTDCCAHRDDRGSLSNPNKAIVD